MNSTIVPSKADIDQAREAYIAAHAPIELGSARHTEFLTYLVEKGKSPEYIRWVRECADPHRIGLEYGDRFGVIPPFPANVLRPAWATEHDDAMMTPRDDLERAYSGTLLEDGLVKVVLERSDWYDFETGKVTEGETVMRFHHGRSEPVDFIDIRHARDAAIGLLIAIERWDSFTRPEAEADA